jgi:2-polyprenyl-6-methoxyphenol hydroxylase-like FAD-dependent oxidoreductase
LSWMVDDSSSSVSFRDVLIVGGGCYGTFYAGQLLRAAERGRARFRRVLVIDRDPECRFAREIG